ncbi:MAG: hypothetical protein K0S18_2212 [Anaerocolumna sp.]|jgi:protein arginine kinase activator|nr:hypothetical protein [Anaerocolumna sp.]
MLCDKCKKNEAKVYYTEIVNGEKSEQHLCEECATELTSFQMGASILNPETSLGSLLSTILGNYHGNPAQEKERTGKELHCDKCGMTYSEFLRVGRFGCDHCYDSFDKVLEQSIRNIQGSDAHTGKKPKDFESKTDKIIKEMPEIDKLSIRLQDAIEKEEFEEAARLRDQIRKLRKEEINNA